jgi:dihydroorotate dehydrogenase (NAD+) catalytic subunit
MSGRLYGRLVLPLVLNALMSVRSRVAVPLVGCGGVYDVEDAMAMLECGASAVQVAAALWRDPSCLARIAHGLAA